MCPEHDRHAHNVSYHKDEEIRGLLTRVETESTDKVAWMNKAKFWKKEPEKLGYGDDDVIPLTPRVGGNA